MSYTAAGKNLMLNALRAAITHIGGFAMETAKAFTVANAGDVFTAAAHGYANGDVVKVKTLVPGAGLVINRTYFVIGATANTFQVSTTSGGAAAVITSDGSGTIARYVEITGGAPAYARAAIAFNAADDGAIDDSTNGAQINVPAAGKVSAAGFHSAAAAGTVYVLKDVTEETYAGQGIHTFTDADLDLNGAE